MLDGVRPGRGDASPPRSGFRESLAPAIHARVLDKLRREPVEDFRIDFEDGYGNRPDAEEDGHAVAAAREVATGHVGGDPPPRSSASASSRSPTSCAAARSARSTSSSRRCSPTTGGQLPDNFVVTLPKVTVAEQVAALAETARAGWRRGSSLPAGALELEIMVETPQAIVERARRIQRPAGWSRRRGGRCIAAHFGTYDYTAALDDHRGIPEHGAPRLRLRAAHDAGRARGHRRLAFRRSDERAPGPAPPRGGADAPGPRDRGGPGDRPQRLEAPLPPHPPLARLGLLPGLGPAPGAASDALRRALRVLPRRPRRGVRAPAQLRRESRPGDPRRRSLRRRRDRPGPSELLPAGDRLRRRSPNPKPSREPA